jgi:hypothetical protein
MSQIILDIDFIRCLVKEIGTLEYLKGRKFPTTACEAVFYSKAEKLTRFQSGLCNGVSILDGQSFQRSHWQRGSDVIAFILSLSALKLPAKSKQPLRHMEVNSPCQISHPRLHHLRQFNATFWPWWISFTLLALPITLAQIDECGLQRNVAHRPSYVRASQVLNILNWASLVSAIVLQRESHLVAEENSNKLGKNNLGLGLPRTW